MQKHVIVAAITAVALGGSHTATAEPPDPGTYQGKSAKWWAKRAVQARKDANARGQTIKRLRHQLVSVELNIPKVIEMVFGPYATQAQRVAWCESKWYTGATNGQYQGMFQMGSSERRLYGHGSTPFEQAQAAYRYFVASGRDWSPWECKPWRG